MKKKKAKVLGRQTVTIEDVAIPVEIVDLPLGDVLLDPENPRIRENLKKRDPKLGPLTQEELRDLILQLPGVSELSRSIRDHKGLHERIYVRQDGRVAEGNCRTASYMWWSTILKKDTCWKTIPALRLPATVTERQIAVLQGHMHVAGKITWRRHEQAGHLHYMNKTLKMEPPTIARAIGLRESEVKRLIQTYELMNQQILPRIEKGDGREKFSTIDELFKVGDLADWRSNQRNVKLFTDWIVQGKIKRGRDVRALPKILGNSRAFETLKKEGFTEAISIVGKSDPTADAPIFKKLKDTATALAAMPIPIIDRLRAGANEQRILKDLHSALRQVADTAGVKL